MLLKAMTCTLLLILVACDGKQKIALRDASLQDEPAELYLNLDPYPNQPEDHDKASSLLAQVS